MIHKTPIHFIFVCYVFIKEKKTLKVVKNIKFTIYPKEKKTHALVRIEKCFVYLNISLMNAYQ